MQFRGNALGARLPLLSNLVLLFASFHYIITLVPHPQIVDDVAWMVRSDEQYVTGAWFVIIRGRILNLIRLTKNTTLFLFKDSN